MTGVRFKRYENRIHLELQQGILTNGRINPGTVRWKKSSKCNNAKPVVYNFRGTIYKGLKLVLQDMILPSKAFVTGEVLMRYFIIVVIINTNDDHIKLSDF